MNDDIAIVHDQFHTYGGAERVAVELAREFDAPIYVMSGSREHVPDDVELVEVAGRIGKQCMQRGYLFQDIYQMIGWQHQPELHEYDTIIETKMNSYWFVPRDTQTIVRYSHSTPRNLYDLWHERHRGAIDAIKATAQRTLYQHTVPYADSWVSNSELVEQRIVKYFGMSKGEISVVHPPVDTESLDPDEAPTQDYLFSVGRLAHNKRLELLMEAAEHIDRPIKIAGKGPERETLEKMAPKNVEFLGYISAEEKRHRLSEAVATVFVAENEDFGIAPVESLAAGTPVIGVDEGFTRHQIIDGKNGLVCEATPSDIRSRIQDFDREGVSWSDSEIAEWATEWFSCEQFREQMREVITQAQGQTTVTPAWEDESQQKRATDDVELTMAEGEHGD